MPTDMSRSWLTDQAYDRARIELAMLRMERATGSRRGLVDDEQRSRRIRKLAELLSNAIIGQEPPDDGVAEPGMVLTVRYEADGETERFLMADREEASEDGQSICSPHSPLGAALVGARVAERRELRLPTGALTAVTLVGAMPYRAPERPRTA